MNKYQFMGIAKKKSLGIIAILLLAIVTFSFGINFEESSPNTFSLIEKSYAQRPVPPPRGLDVPCPLCSCRTGDTDCIFQIRSDHYRARNDINENTSIRFTEHRGWLVNTFFTQQVLPALMLFTEQMSAVAMQQTMIIGQFLDAKHQLETQRLLQELQVQAHKDYQPSEDFCWFGTNVRSLAASEQKGRANAYLLARRQNARQLGEVNMGGAPDGDNDKSARWNQYLELFCDPQDSDWVATNAANTGLVPLCNPAPTLPTYTNADIDYTRLIDNPRTISVDEFGTGVSLTAGLNVTPTEEAVFALGNNLYGHDIIARIKEAADFRDADYKSWYMALRSVVAKRSVAENSFNAIVALKSEGTPVFGSTLGPETYRFLGPILIELGVPSADVREIIGSRPSYYAQLELLAKKIYQNPDFYAGLYDKPANVQRKSVALKAIELMVDRAIYESQIRQEMLSSVLLSARLHEPFKAAEQELVPR